MGKAADNEKRKLRATYYNTIASGLTVVGYILPLISLGPIRERFFGMLSWEGFTIRTPDDMKLLWTVTAAIVSLIAAYGYRWKANSIASGIED